MRTPWRWEAQATVAQISGTPTYSNRLNPSRAVRCAFSLRMLDRWFAHQEEPRFRGHRLRSVTIAGDDVVEIRFPALHATGLTIERNSAHSKLRTGARGSDNSHSRSWS
jgi:hypothetical protein